jgi:hypothetical protein
VAKKSLVDFVAKVTTAGSADFVPVAERIATFDNDGTLWSEQPMYFQAFFVFDRIKQLAPQHPEWKDKEPFASVLKGDVKSALAGGEHALLEMVMATHAGMTTEEFEKTVTDRSVQERIRTDRICNGPLHGYRAGPFRRAVLGLVGRGTLAARCGN